MTERRVDDTIALPWAPDIPGLTFRRYRGTDDLPGIAAGRPALVWPPSPILR
jgi:hypothetical protein